MARSPIQNHKCHFFVCSLIGLSLSIVGCNDNVERKFCADERGRKFKFSADLKNEFDLYFTADGNNVSYRIRGVSFTPDADHITIKSNISSKRVSIEGFLTLEIGKQRSTFKNVICVASGQLNGRSKHITVDCVNTETKTKNRFYWDSDKGITKFVNISSGLGDLVYFPSGAPRLARFCDWSGSKPD